MKSFCVVNELKLEVEVEEEIRLEGYQVAPYGSAWMQPPLHKRSSISLGDPLTFIYTQTQHEESGLIVH